ncbi:7-cyano-7-deazaguanine synthase [Paludibacter jiangxiensis]|uniref:7-cyano-7-deazaguanine synthase n=2 Tax=Paludibacter jiangxiensis TaxID=681398 RepID=A0A170YB10_9BACT|nr:7-cyano-7-deazaguanine synthase [Paludibacter jiangxiensis]
MQPKPAPAYFHRPFIFYRNILFTMNALIVYSGGLDSSTLLHQYKDDIRLAVSFHYGSKHNDREISYARQNCEELGIRHIVINLGFMNEYFRSDLLQSGGDIPEGHYEADNMRKTIVPFRNGIMLSIAVGLAESNDLDAVLIGNHFGDHAIYPDCRRSFIDAFTAAAKAGTEVGIQILSPYCDISKREIALIGQELGIDYNKTYSCYKGGEKHCGKCGTCVERKEALEGFDPTEYEA